MEDKYCITYDSAVESTFNVNTKNGSTKNFPVTTEDIDLTLRARHSINSQIQLWIMSLKSQNNWFQVNTTSTYS